jgi:hypothetical protein
MWATLLNAKVMSAVKCMARNKPVKIWVIKHRPRIDPKFHHAEMLIGAGKSTSALLAILIKGWYFRADVIIW